MNFAQLQKFTIVVILTICSVSIVSAQNTVATDTSKYITLKASSKYNKSAFYKFFWGEHYRKEWNTPVTVKKVLLDTLRGGVKPYQTGGSRQTKSLRVTDKKDHEYAFRSVDKTFGKALPPIALGSFVEKLANDQVTISHPYGGLIVAPMAEAAKIYHATPQLFYVPVQPALGKFNDSSANTLYTFEQRPDEDWSTEPDFGNSKKIVSTEKMLEKILDDNDNLVDQRAFAKARLFDMLIGDWGRHEDQWRWATFNDNKKTIYVPIPRDRDNAFTKFDGFLLRSIINSLNVDHLQTFDYKLNKVNEFNFPGRHLDHHLLNEISRKEWLEVANELKASITDKVIDDAVKQMPAEVYNISGPSIAAKLKSRRNNIDKWAAKYYEFLSEDIEITGTQKQEKLEINRVNDKETIVNIYKITKDGETKNKPYYTRTYFTNETNEIRIYGISGNDEYVVKGKVNKGIKIRLIGGIEKDNYVDESSVKGISHKTKIYDNPGNDVVNTGKETQVNLSTDTAINRYNYRYFKYNKNRLKPIFSYNNPDRIYVGIAYISQKEKWRKTAYANAQYFDVKYSLSQMAFSSTYKIDFLEYIGKWNLRFFANYDAVKWTNFYGLGNNTVFTTTNRDFFRIRSEEINTSVTTDRIINNKHKFSFIAGYNTYKILKDTSRYLAKQNTVSSPAQLKFEDFGTAEVAYIYQHINDSVIPTKGISFKAHSTYINSLKRSNNSVTKFGAEANVYLPLSKKFGFLFRGGATTLSGNPQFFQYNTVGGTQSIRGYQRDRFYGNSTVFSQNEIRYITNVRSFLFNGKIGIYGLYDVGRVWLKGEKSNDWKSGYGAGLMISPFNRVVLSTSYAVSPEDANIHISFSTTFK